MNTIIETIRQRWASKTYKAGLILSLLTLLEANANLVGQFLPPEYRAWLLAAWPLVMFACREVTTTALGDK